MITKILEIAGALFLVANLRLEREEPCRENLLLLVPRLEAQRRRHRSRSGGAERLVAADERDGAAPDSLDVFADGEGELNPELSTAVCLHFLSETRRRARALAFNCHGRTCNEMVGVRDILVEACVAVDGADDGGGRGFVRGMLGF